MAKNSADVAQPREKARRHRPTIWVLLAAVCAGLVVLPLVALVWIAATPSEPIWAHLVTTSLARYVTNTICLMITVGAGTVILGTGLAYLVTHIAFPGRWWLQYALFFPLAVPAYIAAFAVVDFFEFAGPLQVWLRSVFGWSRPGDYWFFEIRSFGGAASVFTLTLYPYVYLLARSSFRSQAAGVRDTARSLGLGPLATAWRVSLPLARPGIVAGVAIVMMETISDFGTVEFFAVQTLTTGIFSVWLESYNAGGAAQLSLCLLILVIVLVSLERIQRQSAQFNKTGRQTQLVPPRRVSPVGRAAALVACLIVFALGFGLPMGLLITHALAIGFAMSQGVLGALANSVVLGSVTAGLTVIAGFAVVYGVVQRGGHLLAILSRISTLGYAIPGAVLGIGLLSPLAGLDHLIANGIEAVTGRNIGLLFTGGIVALIFAYVVRFFAIAIGAAETGFASLPTSVTLAARTLGASQLRTLGQVTGPMMKTSVLSALLLVFVDTVKELPATLLLRPFGFETLATYTYAQATLENLAEAAVPALMIVALSVAAVIFLARTNR